MDLQDSSFVIVFFREMAMMNGAVMGKQAQQPPPPAKPGGIEDLAQVNKPQHFAFRKPFTNSLHPVP